jgi:hypothetical protein
MDPGIRRAHTSNSLILTHPSTHYHPHPSLPPSSQLITPTEDERSIANRLATAAPQNDDTSSKNLDAESKAAQVDPTAPAKMHGNEPSRGAQIDKELMDEEAEIIRKMDEAKAQKKGN